MFKLRRVIDGASLEKALKIFFLARGARVENAYGSFGSVVDGKSLEKEIFKNFKNFLLGARYAR